jgi:hypothetical protein
MNKIILFVLTAVFIFSFSTTYGQCKWDKKEIDPFTGKVNLASKVFFLHRELENRVTSDYCEIQFILNDGEPQLDITYALHPSTEEKTIKDLLLEMKLSDGSVLSWPNYTNFTIGTACCYATLFKFRVSLSESDVKLLSENMLVGGRFSFNTYEYTFPIKKNIGKRFLKASECFQKEVQAIKN